MSLRDLFENELKPVNATLDVWLASLGDKDRADVLEYVLRDDLSNQAFIRVVSAQGVRVAKETVSRWRKKIRDESRG